MSAAIEFAITGTRRLQHHVPSHFAAGHPQRVFEFGRVVRD